MTAIWNVIKKPFIIIGGAIVALFATYVVGRVHGKNMERERALMNTFEEKRKIENDINKEIGKANSMYDDIMSDPDIKRRKKRILEWSRRELGRS